MKIKYTIKYTLPFFLLGTAVLSQTKQDSTKSETPPVEISFESGFHSKQTWNGMVLHDGNVMRNALQMDYGPLSLITSDNGGEGYGLKDITLLAYTEKFGIGVLGGISRYLWTDYKTTELYAGLSLPYAPLSPSIDFTKDLKSGWHGKVSLSKQLELSENLAIDLKTAAEFGNRYNNELSGLRHATAEINLTKNIVNKDLGNVNFILSFQAGYRLHIPLKKEYNKISEYKVALRSSIRM